MAKPHKHKRKGPKSTRGGCLMCKPYKRQGTKRSLRDRPGIQRINEYDWLQIKYYWEMNTEEELLKELESIQWD